MTGGEEHEADGILSRLVRLAQEATTDPSSGERNGLARLESEIARRRLLGRARSNGLSWLMVMDLAVSIAAIVLVIIYRHSVPGFAVENGSAGNRAYVPVLDDARIRFADGAEAVLESGARTRVAEVYPGGGARIVLEDGKAHFCMTPTHSAKWLVEAGPYSLQLAGTVFDVAWTESEASLDLWLHTGSMTISGPLFPKGLAVRPGQRLMARAKNVLLIEGRPFEDMSAVPSSSERMSPGGLLE